MQRRTCARNVTRASAANRYRLSHQCHAKGVHRYDTVSSVQATLACTPSQCAVNIQRLVSTSKYKYSCCPSTAWSVSTLSPSASHPSMRQTATETTVVLSLHACSEHHNCYSAVSYLTQGYPNTDQHTFSFHIFDEQCMKSLKFQYHPTTWQFSSDPSLNTCLLKTKKFPVESTIIWTYSNSSPNEKNVIQIHEDAHNTVGVGTHPFCP